MLIRIQDALQLLTDKLYGWFNQFVLMLPNAVLAALVLAIIAFLSRYIRKLACKLLDKVSDNQSIVNLFSNIIASSFIALGLFVVLNILNLEKTVTSLLAGAGLAGLAVGLAFQDPIINTISGILMSVKKSYSIGDLVETNSYFGNIEEISLRFTIIRTFSGQKVVIPNKMVIQSPLTNYSLSGARRIALKCGISYGEDLEKVKEVAIEAIESNIDYDKSREVGFFYEGFGDSSINFVMHIWTDIHSQPNYLQTQSDSIIALKKAFDQNGMTIPFPIRTLDFGIKGGKPLSQMFSQSGGTNAKMLAMNNN